MNNKDLLVKSITLLYIESVLKTADPSSDLVRTVLEKVVAPEQDITINHERDIIISLKQLAIEMSGNGPSHEYDKQSLLSSIKLYCGLDEKLYDAFVSSIEPEFAEPVLKRKIVDIRQRLTNHFKELSVLELLTKSRNDFAFRREKIKDVNAWIAELTSNLDSFQVNTKSKDPAIISEVDISDIASSSLLFKDIKSTEEGTSILKTGYQGLNEALQGGFRRGDCVVIGALQHRYKTGFSLSIFKQLALYNKPVLIDGTKKPLLLRISFEDDLTLNMQFLYQSLKENETGKKVRMTDVSEEEMSRYVYDKLQQTGYHVKLMRVDPSMWTYKSICNLILKLESEGYEIHSLMLDYLAQVPTTGCSVGGPMGSDVRDMWRRLRNFCNP